MLPIQIQPPTPETLISNVGLHTLTCGVWHFVCLGVLVGWGGGIVSEKIDTQVDDGNFRVANSYLHGKDNNTRIL